jgi:type II secretory pathway component GspD/PulD (secretin)
MRFRTLVAITVTMCALPALAAELPTAPAPREVSNVRAFRLRSVAAADAARAVAAHFENKKLNGRVAVDVVTNTVFVSAEPDVLRVVDGVVAGLDKPVTVFALSVLVLKVPGDFVEQCGLNVGSGPAAITWTLSARERQMLSALLRSAKERGECEVLSRPTLCVSDNQTGFVQVGQNVPAPAGAVQAAVPVGITVRATPRLTPNGSLLLRTEAQVTETCRPVPVTTHVPGLPYPITTFEPTFYTQGVQLTAELKDGETLVTRIGDKLLIVTPNVIAPPSVSTK